jgi:hypothetical protein
MKLRLDNPQAVLNSLEQLETAYIIARTAAVLSHAADYTQEQLDAVREMKKDVTDTLKQEAA